MKHNELCFPEFNERATGHDTMVLSLVTTRLVMEDLFGKNLPILHCFGSADCEEMEILTVQKEF